MSQTGGGQPPPGRARQLVRRGLKLPYSDLSLTEKSDLPIELGDHFELGLVLPYGIGPNEPRLLQVDDAGNLKVVTATGAQVAVTGADTAALEALLSFTGAQVFQPSAEWSINHNPAAGAQATITRAAGAAGVRHKARRVSFGFSSQAVLAGVSTVTFNLRDGASGAGAILKSWTFDLPAAIIAPFGLALEVSDLGTAATAMTLEMLAAVVGLRGFVNLAGLDGA